MPWTFSVTSQQDQSAATNQSISFSTIPYFLFQEWFFQHWTSKIDRLPRTLTGPWVILTRVWSAEHCLFGVLDVAKWCKIEGLSGFTVFILKIRTKLGKKCAFGNLFDKVGSKLQAKRCILASLFEKGEYLVCVQQSRFCMVCSLCLQIYVSMWEHNSFLATAFDVEFLTFKI